MQICQKVQKGNTDNNTYAVNHKQKLADASNNINVEELGNIFEKIIR